MIQKQIIYDAKTGETRVEEIEVEDVDMVVEQQPQQPTIEERVLSIEEVLLNLL